MKRKTALFKPLKLPPGAWQIRWYGRLTEVPQATQTPFITTYLTRVELLDGVIVERYAEVSKAAVPVSDLPALPLGTVLDSTRLIPALPLHDLAHWADVEVDFSRSNLSLRNRLPSGADGDFLLRRGVATDPDDVDYEGVLVVAGGSGDGLPFVIPCVTVFQFFWARSSTWAQMLVDGRFLDYPRYVFNPHRSYLSGDGKTALIWLRQWMEDADAKFIATLAFNEYALQAGADIYRYLAQPPREEDLRCLRAVPPYQGCIPLRVIRQRVSTTDGDAWLIQCISQCGYVPSIRELRFDRDNDGRSLDETLEDEDEEKLPLVRDDSFGGPPITVLDEDIDLTNEPHSNGSSACIVVVDWLNDQFPGMDEMTATKLPQTETRYANKQEALQRLQLWVDQVSTLLDASSSADLAPHGIIRDEAGLDILTEEDFRPAMGDVFELARGLLDANGSKYFFDDEEWVVTAQCVIPDATVGIGPFFLLPAPPGGKRRAWHYCDKDNRFRKRAICLRVTFEATWGSERRVRYLLDLEGRDRQSQNRILFFWNQGSSVLDYERYTVRVIVDATSMARTTDIGMDAMHGLNSRLRKHTQSDPQEFLSGLFSAENDS